MTPVFALEQANVRFGMGANFPQVLHPKFLGNQRSQGLMHQTRQMRVIRGDIGRVGDDQIKEIG